MGLNRPVDAPDGTEATPTEPSSNVTQTRSVGLPRESRISMASTKATCVLTVALLCACGTGLGLPPTLQGLRRGSSDG